MLVTVRSTALDVAPEPEPLDIRLHAPTPDTVIVRVSGPVGQASSPLLTLRVRQQFERASHVILDLSSASRLGPLVASELRALEAHAEHCGTRLHITGAENPAIAASLRHPVEVGPADAVLAALTTRGVGPSTMEEAN